MIASPLCNNGTIAPMTGYDMTRAPQAAESRVVSEAFSERVAFLPQFVAAPDEGMGRANPTTGTD
jgi:hypothetical protein